MMKGLFNYEHAYRRYTQKLLAEFVKENIQYAEIRPNFMMTNQVRFIPRPPDRHLLSKRICIDMSKFRFTRPATQTCR